MVQGHGLRPGDARATGRARCLALASTLTLVLLLGIWLRPHILSWYHLEAGGQALEGALVTVFPDRLAPEQVVDGRQLESGAIHLREAIRWDLHNFQARRNLARVYLSQGQPQAALEILQPALTVHPDSPLLHLELGDIYDSLGESDEAVRAYEAGRIGSRQAPLAANYLKLADVSVKVSSGEAAIELWRRTLKVDPGNLYALYRLAKIHRDMGDTKTAKTYEEQLRHFDPGSVTVLPDVRLAEYQAQAMVGLIEDGMWQRGTLLNVVSYQVWRFSQGLSGLMTERVLQVLRERWQDDPDILYYQAELCERRGESRRAEAAHRELAARPDYALAYLRLGMMAEAQGPGGLTQAAGLYAQYHRLVPADVLGLRKLVETCSALADSGAASADCPTDALRQELAEKTDERQLVSRILGVSPDKVTLGENLVSEGDFESQPDPVRNWTWGRPNEGPALFLGGPDRYGAEGIIRLTNLWRVGELYANYGQRVSLDPDAWYVSFFDYRTVHFSEGKAAVMIEYPGASSQELPDTAGAWQRSAYVSKGPSIPVTGTLLMGNWGVGEVMFDRVELRRVSWISP